MPKCVSQISIYFQPAFLTCFLVTPPPTCLVFLSVLAQHLNLIQISLTAVNTQVCLNQFSIAITECTNWILCKEYMVVYLTAINPDKLKGMLWDSTEGFLPASKYGRRCPTKRQKNNASVGLSFSSIRATNALIESALSQSHLLLITTQRLCLLLMYKYGHFQPMNWEHVDLNHNNVSCWIRACSRTPSYSEDHRNFFA